MAKQVAVGKIEEFSVGKFTIVTINGREFGVTRLPSGDFRVIRNACPHMAAPICHGKIGGTFLPSAPGQLTFAMEGEILTCPWHGFEYDLKTGQEIFYEDPGKLRLFATHVEDGELFVTV